MIVYLVDVLMEVGHAISKHAAEATQHVSMKRVVLQTHLRLHLPVLDPDWSKLRERFRCVERLSSSPADREQQRA